MKRNQKVMTQGPPCQYATAFQFLQNFRENNALLTRIIQQFETNYYGRYCDRKLLKTSEWVKSPKVLGQVK